MAIGDRRVWLPFVLLLVASTATVAAGGVGLGVGLLTLFETGSLVAALSALFPWAVGTAVLAVADVALLGWTVAVALGRLSVPRGDRLAGLAARAERVVPPLRSLDLAERFEPTPEQRRADLREQYLAGEITETEFERRVAAHLEVGSPRPDATRPTPAADGDDDAEDDGADATARRRRSPTDHDANVEIE